MKISKSLFLSFLFISVISLSSCFDDEVVMDVSHYSDEDFAILNKSLNLPENTYEYTVQFPDALVIPGFANMAWIDDDNATLGRVLFYDKKLSKNGTISCSSCHLPEFGFADNKRFSQGFDEGVTNRNALALGTTINFNVYYGSGEEQAFFLWDERAKTIGEQSFIAITDPVEMGLTEQELVDKISEIDYYNVLFNKAYSYGYVGSENVPIDRWMITSALESFVNSLSTTDSKFDRGLTNAPLFNHLSDFTNYTEEENLGKSLFYNHCGSCHGDKFNRVLRATGNNGLDLEYADQGVGMLEGSHKNGIFKIPSLRNVELSAPYMHDGRFETLEEVINHYSDNIKNHPNLSPELKNNSNQAMVFDFSDEEKQALIAFLHTLTDLTVTTSEKFMDPFK